MYAFVPGGTTPGRLDLTVGPGSAQDRGVDDRIIDLGDYIRRRDEEEEAASRRVFAVWNGDGDRSRLALPLWRSAYLAGASRAAVVWEKTGEVMAVMHPHFVLDLAVNPARTAFEGGIVAEVREETDAPAVGVREGRDVVVFLGERDSRRWYVVIDDIDPEAEELSARSREDIVFLSGECAGLLFYRGLAEAEPEE